MNPLIHAEGDIVAAIDGSELGAAVADAGAWASSRTGRPLTLLQAIERPDAAVGGDLSGNLSLGSQDELLAELVQLDERRTQLVQRRGRAQLDELAGTVAALASGGVRVAQRHGDLVDVLLEAEPQTRLFVLGRRSLGHAAAQEHLGRNVERVIRAVQRPVLVVPGAFKPVRRAVIAFDGSPTARRCIAMIAASPLLVGMPINVVMAGAIDAARTAILHDAVAQFERAGLHAKPVQREGEAEPVIIDALNTTQADLLVMGAYGHSRVRQLLVGSTTTALLRQSPAPVLLLR